MTTEAEIYHKLRAFFEEQITGWQDQLTADEEQIASLQAKLDAQQVVDPPLPSVTLVERDGPFVEAAFQKYATQVAPNGFLVFAYGIGMKRVPLDNRYQLPATRGDLEALLSWEGIKEDRQYAADYYDCDKYSFYLKSVIDHGFLCNGFGVVVDWGSGHSYNLAMLGDGTVLVVEPQGKPPTIFTLEDKNNLSNAYPLLNGIFLF